MFRRLFQTCSTTDVERAHRELRARLADGLCGNHAHSLANLNRPSGCQVATVALDAAAPARFTGQHRTNSYSLHTRTLNLGRKVFVNLRVGVNDYTAFDRVDNIFQCDAADDAITQRLDLLAAFNDGAGGDTAQCAAVRLADDHVLGHVNQPPGQVTGIGGLQCSVSQAFAGTVSGNEVLQNVQ